jgi:hypothetical protein
VEQAMRGLGLVLLVVAAGAACGGRPGPLRDLPDGAPGLPADAAADARPDGPRDGGAPVDAAPLPACTTLVPAGAPLELLSYPGASVYSPSLVALTERVAIQAIVTDGAGGHPYNEVARLAVGPEWPADTALDVAPQPCGTESHSYAQLTQAPGGRAELALAWLGDPGGQPRPLFRTIALDSFTCGATVELSATGSTPWGLVAGAGVAGPSYAGDGYGILWEEITQDGNASLRQPVVLVLDPAGGVVLGPVPVAAAVPYPDFAERTPSLAWSGGAYLLATAFDRCAAVDPLCAPQSVVVTRLVPDGTSSRVAIAATVPVVASGTLPQRPALAHDASGTAMVWTEGPADAAPTTVRAVALAVDGSLAGSVRLLDGAARPSGGLRMVATDLGRAVSWPEEGQTSLADHELGRSRVVLQLLDADLAPRGVPVRLDSPLVSSHNLAPTVALGYPRGLLHTWSARSRDGGREAAFIGLVRCDVAR